MATLPTSSDINSPEGISNETTLPLINNSIQEILDAFQQPTALLDPDEKVISVNSNFLKLFSNPNRDHLIGKKPIEIFYCTFAIDTKWDSQNTEHCRKCGINLKLKGSKVTRQRFTERCNLTFVDETRHLDELQNMKVTISPFTLDGKQLYLFSITDISNDIRRRLLERIFFHDVSRPEICLQI